MSYRYAVGTYGNAVSEKRRAFTYGAAGLTGAVFALVFGFVLGWDVIPTPVAAFLAVGALGCGTYSAMGNAPLGEVYFPRSDGLWLDLSGHQTVNAGYLAGRPPELMEGFPGGFAAATVLTAEPSQRMSAGDELWCVTVIVAAPRKRSYRTRLLLHMLPGDEARFTPGRVLLAARFTMGHPDIALLSERDIAALSPGDRALADEALAVARPPERGRSLPLRDTRSFRLINHSYNVFFALWTEGPYAVLQDIRERGDYGRYLRTVLVFLAGFAAAAVLVLLLVVVRLTIPGLDGSGG